MLTTTYTRSYELTAADCNAQFEMSLSGLGQVIVEVATDHANELGVGYKRLQQDGNAWVMMRMTLCLKRMPRVGETFVVETWVESFTRRFSERDFEISVGDEVIGHVRTMWAVINSSTRQPASLEGLEALEQVVTHRDVDFGRSLRVRPADFNEDSVITRPYMVVVSDIDTNRHLTSARYIELMLDMWSLEDFDLNSITRFEINYMSEARFGQQIDVKRLDLSDGNHACALVRDGELLTSATLTFVPRTL